MLPPALYGNRTPAILGCFLRRSPGWRSREWLAAWIDYLRAEFAFHGKLDHAGLWVLLPRQLAAFALLPKLSFTTSWMAVIRSAASASATLSFVLKTPSALYWKSAFVSSGRLLCLSE